MVFRLVMILLGVMMLPTMGYSQIPVITADIPGTLMAGNEVGQTLNSVKSSTESMNFLQKTSAAIGTFQKNVTEFISDNQEKLQKKLEKLEEYGEQVKEHTALVMSYKAQAEEAVDKVKDVAEQAEDAVETAKGYYDQAQDAVETAKSTVETVQDRVEDGVDQAKSIADGVKDQVEDGVDKAKDVVGKDDSSENDKIVEQEAPSSTRKGFTSEDVAANNVLPQAIINDRGNIEAANTKLAVANPLKVNSVSLSRDDNNIVSIMASANTDTKFKTSYGSIKNTSILAFAKANISMKTGETAEGIIIVPKALSVICDLNHEQAAEGKNYSECLKKVNDTAYSQEEGVSTDQRENALKDIANSYLELLATQYFEGLEIYNESFYFKNHKVDPIVNSEVTDVRAAWQYAKDMNQTVGSRIDVFNKINSRALMVKAVGLYYHLGIGSLKDQEKVVASE